MMKEQAKKYINDLKYLIQERMILHDMFSVDKAHKTVLKIERLQNRALSFKSIPEKTSSSSKTPQGSTSAINLQPIKQQTTL